MIETLWTPTQADFDAFARLSGDANPIHTDPTFSARSRFGRTVSHGMLIHARLWAMLATAWPESHFRTHEMMFPNPAFAGEPLHLRVQAAGEAVTLTATRAQDGAPVYQGRAMRDGVPA